MFTENIDKITFIFYTQAASFWGCIWTVLFPRLIQMCPSKQRIPTGSFLAQPIPGLIVLQCFFKEVKSRQRDETFNAFQWLSFTLQLNSNSWRYKSGGIKLSRACLAAFVVYAAIDGGSLHQVDRVLWGMQVNHYILRLTTVFENIWL